MVNITEESAVHQIRMIEEGVDNDPKNLDSTIINPFKFNFKFKYL
jgi:hypothetical protein